MTEWWLLIMVCLTAMEGEVICEKRLWPQPFTTMQECMAKVEELVQADLGYHTPAGCTIDKPKAPVMPLPGEPT